VLGFIPFTKKAASGIGTFWWNWQVREKLQLLGEIGFDKRNDNWEWQKKILLKQLELAREFDLPVIFHVVKSYYELYKLLKDNFPKVRGYLHGFNSSMDVFEAFNSFDLGYSLNARLPEDKVVQAIIRRGYWEIETDAPYAKPADFDGEYNVLANLIWVKDKIEEIMGMKIWK